VFDLARLIVTALLAAQGQQVELPPAPRGYGTNAADVVVDAAHVLSPDAIAHLNAIAFDVHAKSGGEMAIVTLPDLGGRDVADVALRIGRAWGVGANAKIGDRARNAGVVILVVPKETSSDGQGYIRIETARGVEGFITDGMAGDMQREAIPYFKRRDYDGAIALIARRVAERFASEFQFSLDTSVVPVEEPVVPSGRSQGIPPVVALIVFFVVLSILSNIARARAARGANQRGCNGCLSLLWLMQASSPRGRGGWGGGGGFGGGSFGGGGGFGGFGGGGGFSGGGSSGKW
jgi:uncharacterized protein